MHCYELNECVERKSRKCHSHYRIFPNHPFQSFRKPCHFILLNIVNSRNKSESFKLVKVYCYQSLKSAVQQCLISWPGFLYQCENFGKIALPICLMILLEIAMIVMEGVYLHIMANHSLQIHSHGV